MHIEKLFDISEEGKHCFFGYYDRPQSLDGLNFLYVRAFNEFEDSEVCIYNKESKEYKVIFKTNAVSFQLGNLNNWVDRNKVIVHSNVDNSIKSSLLDIDENIIQRTWPLACYNLSPNKKKGLFFHVENAGKLRPAYGLGVGGSFDNSVSVRDLVNDDVLELDSAVFKTINPIVSEVYVEHGIFLDDNHVVLLARTVINSSNKVERLIQWDLQNNKAWVLPDVTKVTHFCGGKDGRLLFFGSTSTFNRYSKVKKILKAIPGVSLLRKSSKVRSKLLKENYWLRETYSSPWRKIEYVNDGHPCILGDDFIFDTYENNDSNRELYFLNYNTNEYHKIHELRSDPNTDGTSVRCDLHPRPFSADSFSIDSKPDKFRKVITFKIHGI